MYSTFYYRQHPALELMAGMVPVQGSFQEVEKNRQRLHKFPYLHLKNMKTDGPHKPHHTNVQTLLQKEDMERQILGMVSTQGS